MCFVTCVITNAAHRATLIDIEGLDLIAAFTSMSGNANITEMAKCMASEWDSDNKLFLDDNEIRWYLMPLAGENVKRDNKLVYQMLKLPCI